MPAVGRQPKALILAEDLCLDLQCLADSQELNTTALLEFMDVADDDGRIDQDEWSYIFRHIRLEHRWNEEQVEETHKLRRCMNKITDLVTSLRVRLQDTKKAARQDGLQRPLTE
ncbi:MAG: hypothetical protein JXA57_17770 [Armatimonadetes bacterium]|nr:hypothetical protein [Armatimonadota bacterium]